MRKAKLVVCSTLMAICMLFCSVASYADDYWSVGMKEYYMNYDFEDHNYTSVKHIENGNVLHLDGVYKKVDDGDSNIVLTVRILEYPSKRILSEGKYYNTDYPNSNRFEISANVRPGMMVQLFFDASSINNPPGYYRQAYVGYHAYLTY